MSGPTKDVMISLFDESGIMAKPWLEAGFTCYIVDLGHPPAYATGGVITEGRMNRVHADLTCGWLPPVSPERVAFVAAFPPCDHLSVSGARWFKGKGLRRLAASVALFATAAEVCEWLGAPYVIENPVSTISTYWRSADYRFSPHEFADLAPEDNYTKRTCLWAGHGFVMPEPARGDHHPAPDDRIHRAPPSKDRAAIRSKTPAGFARAVFLANNPQGNQLSAASGVLEEQADA